MRVFIDTSAWVARQVKSDINNLSSKESYNYYKRQRVLFYTNSYVLSETYTRLIYDVHLKAALHFHELVLESIVKKELAIIEIDAKQRGDAWFYLKKYSDHKLSFTDATIIANFKEYHIDEIFTFDRHFKEINLPTN